MLDIIREYKSQESFFQSDQGIIYPPWHLDYNITRSMTRIETSTDNTIIESKNG